MTRAFYQLRGSVELAGQDHGARTIQVRISEINDERFGAVNSYPISAWDDFKEVYEIAKSTDRIWQ